MKGLLAALFLAALSAATPVSAKVECAGAASLVCTDKSLARLNVQLGGREALLAKAPMHQALRAEIENADAEWKSGLEDCASAGNAVACYQKRLAQRIRVIALLNRLFAGPHLPASAGKACAARGETFTACYDVLFAAADTAYAIMSRAFAISLAAVNVQTPTAPDGGNQASAAEEAFRTWRAAECIAIGQSPLIDTVESGGLMACQVDLTWKELAALAVLLGRKPHWSERVMDYAPSFRACLDRGRDDDVELRIVDVFETESGDVIRLLGSRGRYDCAAVAGTVSSFAGARSRDARPGEGEAVFVPVQGQRPPAEVLASAGGKKAKCYDINAVIAAEARLSGWIAVSHCD